MEAFRTEIENGVASLQSYLSSVQVRGDTQASLLVGILAGVVVVILMTAYPGKPIDYSEVGIDLAPEMRGGEAKLAASKYKDMDDGRNGGNPRGALLRQEKQESEGEQDIPGSTKSVSDLRRRKGKDRDSTDAKGALAKASGGSDNSTGEWDASRIDEDRLAQKIGSGKAAKMLGLTEDQVRQAVLDAKDELQQRSRGGGYTPRREDSGMGLSGAFSMALMVTGLGALWLFVWTHPNGQLARFLIGAFPREMETLGFSRHLST